MKIIGFTLKKIVAERKKEIKGKLEIKSNLIIDDIGSEKVDIVGEVLKFSFEYSVNYEPGFAELVFKGVVLTAPDKSEDSKTIIKEWKKKRHFIRGLISFVS